VWLAPGESRSDNLVPERRHRIASSEQSHTTITAAPRLNRPIPKTIPELGQGHPLPGTLSGRWLAPVTSNVAELSPLLAVRREASA
jgi:hypothetical protein